MASTYSQNLKIELMGTGEQAGTWGQTTNTNLGTALEEAIVGQSTVNFASDANLTLTLTNSNATQAARAFVLNVTSGVSLTTTRELVVPTINKTYVVQNNTTGGQSITVKTTAGTGITVPNGGKAYLYVDGTNVISAIDTIAANSTTPALRITQTGTGAALLVEDEANPDSTPFVVDASGNVGVGVTTSAWDNNFRALQVGHAAAVISGNNQFGAFGAFYANAVLTGLSTTVYKNAGFATTYTQNDGAHIWQNAPSGTAGNPITFTERMRLDSSGNLGLGVVPSAWGAYKAIAAVHTNFFGVAGGTGGFSNNAYYDGANWRYIVSASPSAKLESAAGTFNWSTAPSGTAGNAISFSQSMTLDASGNLGIGTTSPTARLTVTDGFVSFVSSDANGYPRITATDANAQLGLFRSGDSAGGGYLGASADAALIVYSAAFAERARIDSSGNFGLGVTSNGLSAKMHVDSATNGILAKCIAASASSPLIAWNSFTTGDNLFASFGTEGSFTDRGTIDYNRGGGLVRYNTSSDATLKNIIGDAPQQKSLDILADTRLREYSWKDDATGKPQIGVIAQEVHEVFPGAVSVGGEYTETDAEGNDVTKYRPWAVDKTAWTFHLIAGYQHLKAENDALKSALESLTARISALESA